MRFIVKKVVIIGAGPAGLFAALTLIEKGIKPIIYERGKEVAERKKDIAILNRNQGLNAESNYCFGEGGAGTFSDGKLFSRSKKRGNMQRVMELFHHFGGDDRLLYEAHAHIGSDKLPTIIRRMRECILEYGGEIHFSTCVDEQLFRSLINNTTPSYTTLHHSTRLLGVILAIGHSAHDTYHMLHANGVALATKGFAMGVRAEHPQALINKLMYHDPSPELIRLVGNASYSLVTQVQGRGVYSFCMCPGGSVVAAASEENTVVTNGMSNFARDGENANTAILVGIEPSYFEDDHPLSGIVLQRQIERDGYIYGGSDYTAPAQLVGDFLKFRPSTKKGAVNPTCPTGVNFTDIRNVLPEVVTKTIHEAIIAFDKKLEGYALPDAVLTAPESRSSSPIRILRNEFFQTTKVQGVFPSGEGAGYAGGIVSAAVDGIKCAEAIISDLR